MKDSNYPPPKEHQYVWHRIFHDGAIVDGIILLEGNEVAETDLRYSETQCAWVSASDMVGLILGPRVEGTSIYYRPVSKAYPGSSISDED